MKMFFPNKTKMFQIFTKKSMKSKIKKHRMWEGQQDTWVWKNIYLINISIFLDSQVIWLSTFPELEELYK